MSYISKININIVVLFILLMAITVLCYICKINHYEILMKLIPQMTSRFGCNNYRITLKYITGVYSVNNDLLCVLHLQNKP